MASKSRRIATTIQQRVVFRASFSSSLPSSSHANNNKFRQHQHQQERWIRRCRLLDASRGFQQSDDDDDDESAKVDDHGTRMKLLPSSSPTNRKKRPLPTFPLEARHFGGYHGQHQHPISSSSNTNNNNNNTPTEFHHTLCEMIRNAQERVYIASLYIGPGTSPSSDDCEERELLEALSEISNNNKNNNKNTVSIKIILDENRALRPVPVTKSSNNTDNDNENPTTTSSAEAVNRALRGKGSGKDDNPSSSSSSLYLFRVLPSTMIFSDLFSNTDTGNGNDVGNGTGGWNWLPNPLNEIAGVFHIKLYLVDDQLLLSGANLSREYFRDRMDRYLHLIQGGNGLVDFYAKFIDILCSHSNTYNNDGKQGQQHPQQQQQSQSQQSRQQEQQREEFLRDITEHFQDPKYYPSSVEFQSAHDLFTSKNSNSNKSNNDPNRIVAVGIPTFQAPVGFFRHQHQHHHHHRNNNDDDANKNNRKITFIGREVVSSWSTFWSLFRINKQPTDNVDFITDVEATLNLLRQAGVMNSNNNNTNSNNKTNYSIQLSSAYLNPTTTLLSILTNGYTKIELLTAGKISHGFKPKENKENDDDDSECNQGKKGKNWTIPSIFQQLVDDCLTTLRRSQSQSMRMNVRLYHWERMKWTFHAKGIWLREEQEEKEEQGTTTADNPNTVIDSLSEGDDRNSNSTTAFNSKGDTGTTGTDDDTSSEVAAVVVGSSNFGYRSFCRDMESNLILVFPPSSSSTSSSSFSSSSSSFSSSSSTSTASLLSNSRSSNEDSKGNSNSNSNSNKENDDNTTVTVNDNDNENYNDNTITNTIAHAFGEEWNDLRATATEQHERDTTIDAVTAEKQLPPLSWPIRRALPYIKTFF